MRALRRPAGLSSQAHASSKCFTRAEERFLKPTSQATDRLTGRARTSSGRPSWAILPSARTATRSAICARAGSWVATNADRPSSRTKVISSPRTSSRVAGSRALEGSSRRRSSGLRARATRCCWPPDRLRGKLAARSARPTRVRRRRASVSRRDPRKGKATFAKAERWGKRP